ncbi:MAG: hypothetical protein WKG07_24460 [Hymenobacter sp.]
MSKIPYTGKSQQARQGQPTQQRVGRPAGAGRRPARPKTRCSKTLTRWPPAWPSRRISCAATATCCWALLAAVVAGRGGRLWLLYLAHQPRRRKRRAAMFRAVNYWEADSLKQGHEGRRQGPGLTTVANEYGGTKAGNLANFYAGVAALKQGKFKEALDYLGRLQLGRLPGAEPRLLP